MATTIQSTITKQLSTIAETAIATTMLEQFVVDMRAAPAVTTYPMRKNSTWNVKPALTRVPTSSTYFNNEHHDIYVAVVIGRKFETFASKQLLEQRRKWGKEEYRQAYMEAAVEQGIAWQIKINRERRNLSQSTLARLIGSQQSAISRAEDPSYGRHSLDTLVKVAHAFDCALQVKFVPYSKLARDSVDLSPATLYAPSYSEEMSE